MQINYSQLEKLEGIVRSVPYKLVDWYPDLDDVKEMEKGGIDIHKLAFFLWVLSSEITLTEYEKEVRKYIQKMLYSQLELEEGTNG